MQSRVLVIVLVFFVEMAASVKARASAVAVSAVEESARTGLKEEDSQLLCSIRLAEAGDFDKRVFAGSTILAKFRLLIAHIAASSPSDSKRYEKIEMLNRLLEIDAMLSVFRRRGIKTFDEIPESNTRTYLLGILDDPTVEEPRDGKKPRGKPRRSSMLSSTLTLHNIDEMLQAPGPFRLSEIAVTAFAERVKNGEENSAEFLHTLILGAPVKSRVAAEAFKHAFDMDRVLGDRDASDDLLRAAWYVPCQMALEEPRLIDFLRTHDDMKEAVSLSLHQWSHRLARVEQARLYLISQNAIQGDPLRLDGEPVGEAWEERSVESE